MPLGVHEQVAFAPPHLVNLSKGVASFARLQNWTWYFRIIQLLNDRAFVRGTHDLWSMSLVMAMSMERKSVADLISSAFAFGSDVIYLKEIPILEQESTPTALPLLFLKEFC
jgi:hypothetical protein